jgi:3D (Asp-Asp-Asp) domain-containing protein
MILAQSFWRKAVATASVAMAFVSLYDVTILDSQYAGRQARVGEATAVPAPGVRLAFSATAYCKGLTTTSGVQVTTGVVAADPELLPVGSVIGVDTVDPRYNGIYTVMDTGPSVQGRQLDVYMWSCNEALQFGRQNAHITVLRLGWNPKATTASLAEALTKRLELRSVTRPAVRTD